MPEVAEPQISGMPDVVEPQISGAIGGNSAKNSIPNSQAARRSIESFATMPEVAEPQTSGMPAVVEPQGNFTKNSIPNSRAARRSTEHKKNQNRPTVQSVLSKKPPAQLEQTENRLRAQTGSTTSDVNRSSLAEQKTRNRPRTSAASKRLPAQLEQMEIRLRTQAGSTTSDVNGRSLAEQKTRNRPRPSAASKRLPAQLEQTEGRLREQAGGTNGKVRGREGQSRLTSKTGAAARVNDTEDTHSRIARKMAQEEGGHSATETSNAPPEADPGAFAVSGGNDASEASLHVEDGIFMSSKSSLASGNSKRSLAGGNIPIEATLVDSDPEITKEAMRQEFLKDVVEAAAVDTDHEKRNLRCLRYTVLAVILIALAVTLSVTLTANNRTPAFEEQSVSPTGIPSEMPSPAPTVFTIALCSTYTFVEDVTEYMDTFDKVLDILAEEGVDVGEEERDICAPQSLSAFNIAISLQKDMERSEESKAGKNPGEEDFDGDELVIRYALGVLFFSTNGEEWEHSDNWLEEMDFCTWEGTSCATGSRLHSLILDDNDMEGTIPTEIALLEDLGTRSSQLEIRGEHCTFL
jgi:hypothetical protein